MPKYDNSERLSTVSDKDWCEALDELSTYLRWRLRGKTRWGAHSEKELETPALDYYTEEAVAKLIEGYWKWQDRYTLAQQLIEIAGNLITKQVEKYAREHPAADAELRGECLEFRVRKLEFIELMDPEKLPDVMDEDDSEEMDETYEMVMRLVGSVPISVSRSNSAIERTNKVIFFLSFFLQEGSSEQFQF